MNVQEDFSIVSVGGEYRSSCGYCGSIDDTSVAFGMTATTMTVQVYQDLLDRGWRRSGTWLYLPSYKKTCCPCYTHRLDVRKFKPNKAQAKAARRFEVYLQGKKDSMHQKVSHSLQEKSIGGKMGGQNCQKLNTEAGEGSQYSSFVSALQEATQVLQRKGQLPSTLKPPLPEVQQPKNPSLSASGILCTSAHAFVLAALAKRATAVVSPESLSTSHVEVSAENVADSLVSELGLSKPFKASALNGHVNFYGKDTGTTGTGLGAQVDDQALSSLEQRLSQNDAVPSESPEQQRTASVPSTQRQQDSGMPPDSLPREAIGAEHHRKKEVKIVLRRSSPDLVDLEYPLYRKYQIRQHKDPPYKVSRSQFQRFLIDSPLIPVPPQPGATPPEGFGSFHQQYWIDGVLVAVGVVDILPSCLSSKYFFWDPDCAHLSLGRVSALEEIEWVRQASKYCSSLQYYYMGYYIHTCPKMRYKIDFAPPDLLCPKRLLWIPFDRVKPYLDQEQGRVLSDAPQALNGLGHDCVPKHKEGKHQGAVDVMCLQAVVDRPWGKGNPRQLIQLLQEGGINIEFFDYYCKTLEQLASGLGPVSQKIAISL